MDLFEEFVRLRDSAELAHASADWEHPESGDQLREAIDRATRMIHILHVEQAASPEFSTQMNRRYVVGDLVKTDSGKSAEVIATRTIQQISVRYSAGHQSVFYPSFVYEPYVKPGT